MSDESDAFEEIARQLQERGRAGSSEPGRDWYIVRVELTSGPSALEAPPGRDFLVSPQHTFRQLAEAIDGGFARWDLGHLYVFHLADGTMVGIGDEELQWREAARTRVGRHGEGEVFEYEFDLGDSWMHRCTILETEVDPAEVYGARPKGPVATWGWGTIPDQYGRTGPEG
jgi:hypothetical protein